MILFVCRIWGIQFFLWNIVIAPIKANFSEITLSILFLFKYFNLSNKGQKGNCVAFGL